MQDHKTLRRWIFSRRVWRVNHIPDNHALNFQVLVVICAFKLIYLPAAVVTKYEIFNKVDDVVLEFIFVDFSKSRSFKDPVFNIGANVIYFLYREASKPIFSDDFF
jgi:hypothetical protein